MDKDFCHTNHHKIVKIYKHLITKDGKLHFNNRVQMLKESESKKIMLMIFELKWKQYQKLIDIIKKLCLNAIKYKISNESVQNYVKNLYQILDKIDNFKQLHTFIYRLLDDKELYDNVVKFYEIIGDRSKCVILFR
jgi:hypothetical protein